MKREVLIGHSSIAYEWINKSHTRPVILLLNGSIFNYLQWDLPLRVGFRPYFFRRASFLRYDYRGMGRSEIVPIEWSLERLADDAIRLLDALDVEKVHLYGISKGTIVGQCIARLIPDRVLSLAGYGWFHFGYSGMQAVERHFASRIAQFEDLKTLPCTPLTWEGYVALWKRVCAYVLSMQPSSRVPRALSGFLQGIFQRYLYRLVKPTPLRTSFDWFDYAVKEMPGAGEYFRTLRPNLTRIPILIQHAIRDGTLPFEMAVELKAQLAHAELISYGRSYHHISPMIHPTQARAIIRDYSKFFRGLFSRSTTA